MQSVATVVKSVQQSQPASELGRKLGGKRTIGGAAAAVWRVGGIAGFYRGVAASTARAMLVASSRLLAYEWVKALLDRQSMVE